MPRQVNIAIGTVGTVAWDGATSRPMDIRKHLRFGWSFEVIVDLAVDTVFRVESAPPSEADPCVPGPFESVMEVPTCTGLPLETDIATVTLLAGTPAGTVCGGTIPCRPDAFVRLVAQSGNTDRVLIVHLRQGPMTP